MIGLHEIYMRHFTTMGDNKKRAAPGDTAVKPAKPRELAGAKKQRLALEKERQASDTMASLGLSSPAVQPAAAAWNRNNSAPLAIACVGGTFL